jgi:hypothetical protein
MDIVFTSTTESQTELDRVAAGEDWRTAPPAPEDKRTTNDPSPKEYIEQRNEEVNEKRPKGSRGGYQRRIDTLTRRSYTSEARAIAAENKVKELEARLNGNGPSPTSSDASEPTEPESAPRPQARPQLEPATKTPTRGKQIGNEGRAKYKDFDAVLAAADRAGFTMPSKESEQLLESLPNAHDVLYEVARKPELRAALTSNPAQAVEIIHRVGANLYLDNLPGAREFKVRAAELYKTQKDFADAVRSMPPLPIHVESTLVNAGKVGTDVMLHLARNPQLAHEIAQMPPDRAIMQIGRLIEKADTQVNKPKVRAPEPISPVGASSTRSGTSLEEMPLKAWMQERNKQERQYRRR